MLSGGRNRGSGVLLPGYPKKYADNREVVKLQAVGQYGAKEMNPESGVKLLYVSLSRCIA